MTVYRSVMSIKKHIKLFVIAIITAGLFLYHIPSGLGFLLGSTVLGVLGFVRVRFYDDLLNQDNFVLSKYVGYLGFVFFILWMPLGLAFVFPEVVGPFALAAAYIFDRLWNFLSGLLIKKEGDS